MPFVLDASVALSWAFADERNEYTRGVQSLMASDDACVPSIWPLEVANVLCLAERRDRLTPHETLQFVAMLAAAPVKVYDTGVKQAFGDILSLARSRMLTAYDASYLELALRLGLPIATMDARLRAAASALGVPVLQPKP